MKRMKILSRVDYVDIFVIPMNDELKINIITIHCVEQRVQLKYSAKCSPYAIFSGGLQAKRVEKLSSCDWQMIVG